MDKRTVSVVMCTYNGAKHIREQLDSIISQTYPLHEIIIQDDCSTDDTVDIIREYAQKNPVIKLYVNEHNLGYNNNFKDAVMKTTGNYVAISDQDDIWFPEKIEKQVKAIGDCVLCFSADLRGVDRTDGQYDYRSFSQLSVLFQTFILGHTMLLKSEFAKQEDSWTDGFGYDYSLAIAAFLQQSITGIEEPLSWHRMHAESAIHQRDMRFHHGHPTYEPYLFGFKTYRRLQKLPAWKNFYGYIYTHSLQKEFALLHQASRLLLSPKLNDFFRLCLLCLKHRTLIYMNSAKGKGLMGIVRSFCYPLIFAYNTKDFREE